MRLIKSFFFITFFLGLSKLVFSQNKLSIHKIAADKSYKKEFFPNIRKKIICDDYMVIGKRVGDGVGGKYIEDKDKVIGKVEFLLFFYSLYSNSLNYTFRFHVVLDSNFYASIPNGGIEDIPNCVRKGISCKFISWEKAILLAKKDSIMYPDNLTVSLKRKKNTMTFFWEVSGQDKQYIDYSKQEPEDGWQSFPIKKENTRYINAVNSQIISYEQFNGMK